VINRGRLALFILIFQISLCFVVSAKDGPAKMKLAVDHRGINYLTWSANEDGENYIDKDGVLGKLSIKYRDKIVNTNDCTPTVLAHNTDAIKLLFQLPENITLLEEFKIKGGELNWSFKIANNESRSVVIQDLYFPVPIGAIDQNKNANSNLSMHYSINGNGSFFYWIPYSGEGDILLVTPLKGTSLEYFKHGEYYIHSSTSVDRVNDTWRLPGSHLELTPGANKTYGFCFQTVQNTDQVRQTIFDKGGIDVRVVPGMTLPENMEALCAIRVRDKVHTILAEYPEETSIKKISADKNGYSIYRFNFKKHGENQLTIKYGDNKLFYLDFFITEPLETLIKKRASFIVSHQQTRDTSKWYDGLFSIWDMKNCKLFNPDDSGPFPDYVVGGSDDPSNGKALFVSEKNVVYPEKDEIAAIEYYEKEFVWGGLQRTDKEYPYPYGIYGSENWYENRSGNAGGFNSGGWGKERMWRSFDYTTHFALYYNLYRIAKDYPEMVEYLDAKGYLERAYRTAMAFFEVPYNIKMGEFWNFHGWCDWAYKQGNFHERYITDIIQALEQNGDSEKAFKLRCEWEKKVKYFIYDDPWPFGSEMFVDRTAFESSYYIGEYAKKNQMQPDELLWYDKNREIWYSHPSISDSATDYFLKRQLDGNLALRGIIEPGYNKLGTAWASSYSLDYMSQMGGAAILDYAVNFSKEPANHINIGYNSILSSWALMNTGKNGVGYWYPNKINDGAVGWVFTNWQFGTTWFRNISTPRGPWQYCGEIDHGLVGGVHALATYVVNDPLFGFVAYGGKLSADDAGYNTVPLDGVRRRFFIQNGNQFLSVIIRQDGFKKDAEIKVARNYDKISFSIEKRIACSHECTISLSGLKQGRYKVTVGGDEMSSFDIAGESSKIDVKFLFEEEFSLVEITRI
jgi:hypothetical protein